MTRIYTIGMESISEKEGSYLVVLVAHRDSRRAKRVAMAEAKKREGRWSFSHLAERRTGLAIPMGEVLGASGPFNFEIGEE